MGSGVPSPPTAAHSPLLPAPLQAAAFAELLCRAGPSSAAQLVACQGVPFLRHVLRRHAHGRELFWHPLRALRCRPRHLCAFPACRLLKFMLLLLLMMMMMPPLPLAPCRDMIDEQQQHPQQLELAGAAVACFWLLLRHAAAQRCGWPIRWGC